MAIVSVLDQQQRNGAFSTGSIAIPAGALFVNLSSTMSDADSLDTAKKCFLKIGFSYDGGVTYYSDPAWQGEWVGGVNSHGNPNVPSLGISTQTDPRLSSPTYNQPPQRAMANVDTEGFTLNVGFTLEAR